MKKIGVRCPCRKHKIIACRNDCILFMECKDSIIEAELLEAESEFVIADDEKPCWNCAKPTNRIEINYQARLCSEKCVSAKDHEVELITVNKQRTEFVKSLEILKKVDGFNKRFGLDDLVKNIDNLIVYYRKE